VSGSLDCRYLSAGVRETGVPRVRETFALGSRFRGVNHLRPGGRTCFGRPPRVRVWRSRGFGRGRRGSTGSGSSDSWPG